METFSLKLYAKRQKRYGKAHPKLRIFLLSSIQRSHVRIVGKASKKCLSFGVAKKNCRSCKNAIRKKVPATKHKCRKNCTGSSKVMEPFLSLECLQHLKRKGLEVNALTMDDDTSTYARVKRCLFPSLRTNSDKNHVVKNMTNCLYKKYFSYAVSQNQGDPDDIKRNLTAIVPHSYGEHGDCDQKWCRAGDTNYRHSSLPRGKNLTGQAVREDIKKVRDPYTSAKMTEKLATLSTTNPNEHNNMMISRKAPKGSHYSESESLDIRERCPQSITRTYHNKTLPGIRWLPCQSQNSLITPLRSQNLDIGDEHMSIVGNVLVYLMSLAVCDSLYLLFCLTLSFLHCSNTDLSEEAFMYIPNAKVLSDLFSNTAVWLTVCFTLERFIAVRLPMRGKTWCTVSKAKVAILMTFVVCAVNTLPEFFETKIVEISGNYSSHYSGRLTGNDSSCHRQELPEKLTKRYDKKRCVHRPLHHTLRGNSASRQSMTSLTLMSSPSIRSHRRKIHSARRKVLYKMKKL
ncbi:hypothetical protein MAR_031191 [Mya arenaria]|uniref:G-protein coupled receptors family 1 profile domain-containing protein n=1 Tax=Mya arenaria TaxID=6604 RepID=A0ABY7F342_MYAAR|nr:hypothetical protein MAR_031191 [Mya arenaria]